MPTETECVCCSETKAIGMKIDEYGTSLTCITNDDGFEPVCLNI